MAAKTRLTNIQHSQLTLWVLVFLLAFVFRITGVGWDNGTLAHPDERGIAYIVEQIGGASTPAALNPLQDAGNNPTYYAYGHLLPFIFAMVSKTAAPSVTLPQVIYAGRILSALASTLTVAVVGKLAVTLYRDQWTGLLAASLFSFTVISIQNAHFATADTLLTLSVTASMLFILRYHHGGKINSGFSAAVLAGLAFSLKPTGALVLVPLLLVPRRWKTRVAVCTVAGLTMAAANPFMLVDVSHFATNIWAQIAMVSGRTVPPFTVQFIGQPRGWYSLIHAGVWGIGAPALAAGGVAFLAIWTSRRMRKTAWPLLTWVTLGILLQASAFAQFPRYALPYVPSFCVLAAGIPPINPRLARLSRVSLLALTAAQGLVFLTIYSQPHPFSTASLWLYEHVQPGEVLLVETWDEPLPANLIPAGTPIDAGMYQISVNHYAPGQQDLASTDFARHLSQADWVVLSTSRGYGTLPRLADEYPVSAAYYRVLFNGDAGYELAARFYRPFHLGPCRLIENSTPHLPLHSPDYGCVCLLPQPDSSFANYDHPQVLVFSNEERLPEHAILAVLEQNTR